ncbi:MAG: 3-dehydroquinate synthase [Flavobacteriaceae bacterium]|nr:3-dehydroquinate synthase [Flavobacteriaceae bacterium]
MKSIVTSNYSIHFNSTCYTELNLYLKKSDFSKIFIIVDTNTHNFCYPYFIAKVETNLEIEIIEIEAGEIHKTIDTCVGVWNALSDLNADRKSLIINLGGGVVTDLGGFVASTFKRGIKYINVPTTLLAMVDASVGGKTGVDLDTLKNQIGVINPPQIVLVDTQFLSTLPQNEIRSGFAEMLKHGLIQSEVYWDKLKAQSLQSYKDLSDLIYESIIIKQSVVDQDPFEDNLRKTLNFGHTLGHAIESYYLSNPEKPSLLHGEAIAIGMVLAAHISKEILQFSDVKCQEIKTILINIFDKVEIVEDDYSSIIELLKHDKKNEHGNINFVLLNAIGKPKINCLVNNEFIINSLKYYSS